MQEWPFELIESKDIDKYFQHYSEQINDDKKFILMKFLIQALTDIKNESVFIEKWNLLKPRIIKDFEVHEYTIFYWSCFGEKLSDCWKITPYIRELWYEIKKPN